ncbi:MAG: hypothetical protein H8M99_10665 [Gloeobacteraceae cyanobacterium ES-bin-144]|nr:hypothetical protein [Verrucomicrobiales bacterium]
MLDAQELTATSGDKAKPEKLTVEKKDGNFVVPTVKEGEWIIFQYKETAKSKAITARLQYDTAKCGTCKNPEWLCVCGSESKGKK